MQHPEPPLVLVLAPYDGQVVQAMVDELQAEYVVRYGGPDATPVDAAQFAPPLGAFFVATVDGEPVGTAGLRALSRDGGDVADGGDAGDGGDVELKRMYVRVPHRRKGYARRLLTAVEEQARAMGHRRVLLETGSMQPEAVALYRSAGYAPVEPFGLYACAEQSIHLGRRIG